MKNEILSFNKLEKSPSSMEESINNVLKSGQYKFATQHESQAGKLILSLFLDSGPASKVQAKVFRAQNTEDLQKQVNNFFQKPGVKLKYYTQSGGSRTIIGVVFYEVEVQQTTTTPAPLTTTPPVTTIPSQ